MKIKEEGTKNEVQFELKYCERCGALWLRPTGGGQIYCKGCAHAMAQLPPPTSELDTARPPGGPLWDLFEIDQKEMIELDGGVA